MSAEKLGEDVPETIPLSPCMLSFFLNLSQWSWLLSLPEDNGNRRSLLRVEVGIDIHHCADSGSYSDGVIMLAALVNIGVPHLTILNDVSTDGRYIGADLVVWTVSMSTMGLIILPKVLTVHRIRRLSKDDAPKQQPRRQSELLTSARTSVSSGASPTILRTHSATFD